MLNKMKVFLAYIILCSSYLFSQTFSDYVKIHAIDCNVMSDTNNTLYSALKNYKCISVGEMHGTKEPAEYVLGLVKTFSLNKRNVILGLEIENRKILNFASTKNSENLKGTEFFNVFENDGRNSEAWYNLIYESNKLPNVNFCFFDTELGFNDSRDSVMASNILKKYLSDTNCVIITLSGNLHNKTTSFKGKETMGCYIEDYFGPNMFSILHLYGQGTMYNNTGQGLQVNVVEQSNKQFDSVENLNNYFIINSFENYMPGYSAFIYTKLVTASLSFIKKAVK